MMQSCASAAKAPGRRAHSSQRRGSRGFGVGSPPPRMVIGSSSMGCQAVVLFCLPFRVVAHDAARKMMPLGTSPMVTRRQSAMSSLRASATIMILRVALRPSVVRALNHWARALSF